MRHWKIIIATLIATTGTSLVDGKEISRGTGVEAIQQAQQQEKHLFFFFYKDSSPPTHQMLQVFDEAVKELNSESLSMKISIFDPAEHSIVKKFDLQKAPMPLAIILAPNGVMV